ncbi:glycoside hydrolase family 43 protein [Roseimarinus sediminis]|uniref:glycoside hydrolase family 43 protein n=1 Tax=Roseimarinus sediminis TaxID=1610899 RepID=UPI003D238BD1
MKTANWILLLLLTGLLSCQQASEEEAYLFTTFREPATEGLYLAYSNDGYNWEDLGGAYLEPGVGKQKVMRDPSVVQGPDGTFHMVWTSSWKGDLGFGYASSKDFINWSEQHMINAMAFDTSTVNVWAPEIFYDDVDDRFIIIWASTIPFKFERGIEEERNNHRMYYTTTKDFKTFTETKLFLDPGFSVIDCVIVKRKKNDYVLVVKDNTRPNRNISVAFGETPLGPFSSYSEPFTGFLTEGPTVVKVDNDYLIYYDSYGDKSYKAVKTTDFVEFTDITDQISLPEGHKHGTIVKVKQALIDQLLENKK